MERFDLIGAVLSSSLVTWILSKIFSKKKEDIELALNYQKFYKDLIEDLELKIEKLSSKVEILIEKDNEKTLVIERLEKLTKQKDKQISKLFKEIEEHENGHK